MRASTLFRDTGGVITGSDRASVCIFIFFCARLVGDLLTRPLSGFIVVWDGYNQRLGVVIVIWFPTTDGAVCPRRPLRVEVITYFAFPTLYLDYQFFVVYMNVYG